MSETPTCPNCGGSNTTPYHDPHHLCDNPNCRVKAFRPEGVEIDG